jgi:hypothetical protein
MPPWKPIAGYGGPFLDERRLTDVEIRTIARWVDQGAPEGDPADLPPRPDWPEDWRLGPPDLVVTMAEPYLLRADGPSVFRNFVIPIPITETEYVAALEYRPGNARVVHHANLRIDQTPSSRELDEADPVLGYEGRLSPGAQYPDGYFLGWTPGQLPRLAPRVNTNCRCELCTSTTGDSPETVTLSAIAPTLNWTSTGAVKPAVSTIPSRRSMML